MSLNRAFFVIFCHLAQSSVLIFMLSLFRVRHFTAEAEGFDPGHYPQHQHGEAAQPGRRYQH